MCIICEKNKIRHIDYDLGFKYIQDDIFVKDDQEHTHTIIERRHKCSNDHRWSIKLYHECFARGCKWNKKK